MVNGEASRWGDNGHCQTGAPPGQTGGAIIVGQFTAIDAGCTHTCALRADNGIAQFRSSNES